MGGTGDVEDKESKKTVLGPFVENDFVGGGRWELLGLVFFCCCCCLFFYLYFIYLWQFSPDKIESLQDRLAVV